MITAVQERRGESDPSAAVIHGKPLRTLVGRRGPIRLFHSGEIVAYVLQANGRARIFVFRTLERPVADASIVPGVQPRVRVLIVADKGRRIYRARQMLATLGRLGLQTAQISDRFYLSAATTLGNRAPIESVVKTLLTNEMG
jgi:hypothetical protein